MSDIAVRVEGLGKRYRIGERRRNQNLRERIQEAIASPFRRKSVGGNGPMEQTFWALKDINFKVSRGEVIGIIGRNGAGKSTLLKILSRITDPTEGEVEIVGRVGSLLEVGTGFHPELTGRENVYLNGAIIGMKQSDIGRKFDEIVAFAEVQKFLDTPVKHYSSGMYMRLAFAVAAYLEPEVLIVDEVLAVGDATFQRKCLGRMSQVAEAGRTVLFVSHNMQAIRSLCQSALQLDGGRLVRQGTAAEVIAGYMASDSSIRPECRWEMDKAPGTEELKLLRVWTSSDPQGAGGVYSTQCDLRVDLEFVARKKLSALCVGFDLMNADGVTVFRSYHTDQPEEKWPVVVIGLNRLSCTIPRGLLNGGVYYICPRIGLHNLNWIVQVDRAVRFELVLDHGTSPMWNSLTGKSRIGLVAPIFTWNACEPIGK